MKKIQKALKSSYVGLITGLVVQYIVQFVIKLFKRKTIKEAAIVDGSWIVYYTAAITGGINGFLLPFIPTNLYPFSSVLVAVAVYNGLLLFSNEVDIANNKQSNLSFTVGIIRDLFLINFIIFIVNKILPKSDVSKKDDFNSLLSSTISISIIISISFSLSQTGINNILRLTNSLDVAITDE